jgi:SAM-dependent methyltransferase
MSEDCQTGNKEIPHCMAELNPTSQRRKRSALRPFVKRMFTLPALNHVGCILYQIKIGRKLTGTKMRECPICEYIGKFRPGGVIPRYDSECSNCGALERHRIVYLALQRRNLLSGLGKVLHFAPEPFLAKAIRQASASYRSADLEPGLADMVLNIEKLDLPDDSVDTVVANHVLEHVDDRAALLEIWRILVNHGRLIVSVPVAGGCATTYENPAITSRSDRELHFGQADHVRFYGRDFSDRLSAIGFSVDEFTCDGPDTVKYALQRGESVFICTKA